MPAELERSARPVLIVTGSPGAGKTTLCARLAARSPRGVHLESDLFYGFLAHPLSPLLAEAHEQNGTVIRSLMRAASGFALGGYDVFLDGIVGPWFMPLVREELASCAVELDYVVLGVAVEIAIERAGARAKPAGPEIVKPTHAAFAELGEYTRHAFDVLGRSREELADAVSAARAAGQFRVAR